MAVAIRNIAKNIDGFAAQDQKWKCPIKYIAKNIIYIAIEYRIHFNICLCFCSWINIICYCFSSIFVFIDKSSISDDFNK